MIAENIKVIYNTHNIKSPTFYINEISQKHPSIKIKDGCTELTDEAGLKFIKEELTYMEKYNVGI